MGAPSEDSKPKIIYGSTRNYTDLNKLIEIDLI